MDTAMQDFYGRALQPPNFGRQAAPQRNPVAEEIPAGELPVPQLEEQQADLLLPDANIELFDAQALDMPLPDPESAAARSGNTGFDNGMPTPPSFSNDARPNLAETPEQARRLSQKLPVGYLWREN